MICLSYQMVLIHSVNIQDDIEYASILTTNASFHVYINGINISFVFEIKDGYKLALQMNEVMKLFGSAKD